MTPAGIEPANFGFVAQHLNHCATAVPHFCRGIFCFSTQWHCAQEENMNLKFIGPCIILIVE